jgi:hypothetical protein
MAPTSAAEAGDVECPLAARLEVVPFPVVRPVSARALRLDDWNKLGAETLTPGLKPFISAAINAALKGRSSTVHPRCIPRHVSHGYLLLRLVFCVTWIGELGHCNVMAKTSILSYPRKSQV